LHALMAELWGSLQTRGRLDAIAPNELAAAIDQAAGTAVAKVRNDRPGVLDGRLADLECIRLAKIAREWLDLERTRGGFEVVAREERRTLRAGGLEMHGRIDRMDRLDDGSHVLIDYKTGRATSKDWLEERPDDPQMPLYALGATEKIAAIAYARVKTGGMKFIGIAEEANVLPKVKAFDSWAGWPALWEKNLDALGREFAAGVAEVDPKRGLKTCKYCDLRPLCRVHERLAAIEDEDGDVDGEEGALE